jgi:hypothetical protein
MTNAPTMLDTLSYLTDSTFVSFVALTLVVFIALKTINRIGGRL